MIELRDELAKAIADAQYGENNYVLHEAFRPHADACLAIITPLLDKARDYALEEAAALADKWEPKHNGQSVRAHAIRELKGNHND